MKININGEEHQIETGLKDIGYERLCLEAGKDNNLKPSVTFSIPNGSEGEIRSGERAPLVEGGIYDVCFTNNS